MKKLLIISSRFPFPLDKGDKLRLYYQIKDLSKTFAISLISLVDSNHKEEYEEDLRSYCTSIHPVYLSEMASRINSMWALILNKNLPVQCAYFFNKRTAGTVSKIIENEKPDHIYCQLIRMAPYVEDIDIDSSLDLMDAFSTGAQRRAECSNGLRKWFWTREKKKIIAYEKRIAHKFRNLIIISNLDKQRVAYLDRNIEVINNGIDEIYFLDKTHFSDKTQSSEPEYDAVFVGNMGYFPNIKAVEYIADSIGPEFQNIYGRHLTVNVAGPNQKNLKHIGSKYIVKSGWYDNVKDAYYSGRIFLAPLFEGIGQQNKILESMALGIPCITTKDVSDALTMKHNEHLLIADNPAEFCRHIHFILNNKEEANRIVQNAKSYVENNFKWKSSTARLSQLISDNK